MLIFEFFTKFQTTLKLWKTNAQLSCLEKPLQYNFWLEKVMKINLKMVIFP